MEDPIYLIAAELFNDLHTFRDIHIVSQQLEMILEAFEKAYEIKHENAHDWDHDNL